MRLDRPVSRSTGIFQHQAIQTMLSDPLLTVREVADLLKVSEDTVREWIHNKSLRAIKFGREWRVVVRDLESYLNGRANRPPTDG
jgi:excisionase family DNA binding protein